VAATILGLSVGCAAPRRGTPAAPERSACTELRLRLHFAGNAHLSDEALRGAMGLAQVPVLPSPTLGRFYVTRALAQRRDQLLVAYFDAGYLRIEIGAPELQLTPDRRFVDATIPVHEGSRYRLSAATLDEFDALGQPVGPLGGRDTLLALLDAQPGTWFNRSRIGRGVEAIQRRYRDAGFAWVEVTPTLTPDAASDAIAVGVTIRRGPVVSVRRVAVRGDAGVPEAEVLRQVELRAGDRFSETAYQTSLQRLRALGPVHAFELTTERVQDRDDQLDLVVVVSPRAPGN
jgi:outer membrane protein insertion porin family